MRLLFALSLCAALPLTAGCFSLSDEPNCAFQCDPANNNHCPDDYTCASDGYCHKNGFTGSCGFATADGSGAKPDLTMPKSDAGPDMSTMMMNDMVVVPGADMSGDMAMMSMIDMAKEGDMSMMAMADMVTLPDLVTLPDMVCVSANCTNPPADTTCTGSKKNVHVNPGSCDNNGMCQYSTMPVACTDGCFAGACVGPFVGIASTAADQGGAVTLDTVVNNMTSNMGGPVNHTMGVTVTTKTSPGGTTMGVDLIWSLDPTFAASNTVTMTLTTPTMANDLWTGTIPAQAMGVEVYFFVQATPYNGATATDPMAAMSHFAYAVN